MTDAIQLRCQTLRCELAPALGGCIAGLWFDDMPVLRSTPAAQLTSARQSGSYPLVPFSNRVAHATLLWDGTRHPLVRTEASEPHAIHGVGWQRPWTVLEQSDTFAMLSFEHAPDAAWPFAFDTSQAFRLSPGALEITLAATNQSSTPAPMGLGWHPYFVKRAGARVSFGATGRWEMGPDKLPTHRTASTGLDVDCATLDVDHCFDGWSGTATLADDALRVSVRSSLRRLVVYTQPTRDVVAIEPVSHVNNALSLQERHVSAHAGDDLGLVVLAPGETLSAQMTIAVETVT